MCKCSGTCGCNITSTTKGEKGDASSVASLGYDSYQALLTQTSTSAPTEVIKVNTTGVVPTYSYTNVGVYNIELGALYASGKIGIFISPWGNSNDFTVEANITLQYDGITGYVLRTFNSAGALSNEGLTSTLIEIRKYA